MNKAKQLKKKFEEEGVIRIVGAHDGLSAKLVEGNGFDGVWASGLEISTSYAVPDANILTMTQYLERTIEMSDATTIPEGDSSNTSSFQVSSHLGSHVDAPRHFIQDGPAIDSYDPSEWIFTSPYCWL